VKWLRDVVGVELLRNQLRTATAAAAARLEEGRKEPLGWEGRGRL